MGALGWSVGLHYILVVLGLTLLPAFLGVTHIVALSAVVGLVFSIVALVLSVFAFVMLFCCCGSTRDDPEAITCCGGAPGERGAVLLQAKWIYFLVCCISYAVQLAVWITFISMFGGLDPINVTTNLDAFIARDNAHMVMLLVSIVNSSALLVELRDIWRSSRKRTKPSERM